jgi:hypothetical protein
VAFVALSSEESYEIFFVPVNAANHLTRELGDDEAKRKKKRNKSLNFPIWCQFEGRTSVPHKKAAMTKIRGFQGASLAQVI